MLLLIPLVLAILTGQVSGRLVDRRGNGDISALYKRIVQQASKTSRKPTQPSVNSCGNGKLNKRGACASAPRNQAESPRRSPSPPQPSRSSGSQTINEGAGPSRPAGRKSKNKAPAVQPPPKPEKDNKLKMQVQHAGHVREIAGVQAPQSLDGRWKHVTFKNDARNVDRTVPRNKPIAGQMLTRYAGSSEGKVRAQRVRADVSTSEGAVSIVNVKDPSKLWHPSGEHSEQVSGATTRVFGAMGSGKELAKIKVSTQGQGATQFEGGPNVAERPIHGMYDGTMHRIPKFPEHAKFNQD